MLQPCRVSELFTVCVLSSLFHKAVSLVFILVKTSAVCLDLNCSKFTIILIVGFFFFPKLIKKTEKKYKKFPRNNCHNYFGDKHTNMYL